MWQRCSCLLSAASALDDHGLRAGLLHDLFVAYRRITAVYRYERSADRQAGQCCDRKQSIIRQQNAHRTPRRYDSRDAVAKMQRRAQQPIISQANATVVDRGLTSVAPNHVPKAIDQWALEPKFLEALEC